jgi:hypothetical protein
VAGGNTTFTVQPKTSLGAGTYTATVFVGSVIAKSFDVSFTVLPPVAGPKTRSSADGTGTVAIKYESDTVYRISGSSNSANNTTLNPATVGVIVTTFAGHIIVDGAISVGVRTVGVTMTLSGVNISSNTTASPIVLQNGANVTLVLAIGTTNTLTAARGAGSSLKAARMLRLPASATARSPSEAVLLLWPTAAPATA